MAKQSRGSFFAGLFRSAFSMKGLVIMALGALAVALIGGQAQDLFSKAADKIKSLKS
jgi:hypothetical protein